VKSKICAALFVVGGLLLVAVVFHAQILAAMGGYLVHADPPQKADVALVLAGMPGVTVSLQRRNWCGMATYLR